MGLHLHLFLGCSSFLSRLCRVFISCEPGPQPGTSPP
jgi:hypothetical protein